MADNENEVNQLRGEIRDSLAQLGSGIGEIRSTLTQFLERLTRIEVHGERIPVLEKRIDDVEKRLDPIRDDVVSAVNAAKWANKLAKWIMPAVFSAVAAIAGLYVKDHINVALQPVVQEMHDIQRQQQSDINDLRLQMKDRSVDTRNARY
ncbi:hypothetical protein [Burkholderia cenocepacia]|uniref:hypothetical protein n=1 Tax=Burkholderia cenocepacia TaxID=95486 RepID=UPI002854EDC1|nr:hypothetical protein [Burkholderia cenocepacia]MDR8054215.1 hypothetical protein [Burkholderia cenocepacia]MDR8064658.1 hypothetical protein [Burkholderia cenocepacia]